MKVIHISPSYKPAYIYGGPTVSISKLCETLVNTGMQIDVFTTTANGKTELNVGTKDFHIIDGVNVRYFKRILKDPYQGSATLLWYLAFKTSRKEPRVLIHLHSWWNMVAIFSCLIALWKEIPFLLSPRGMITGYTLNNRNVLYKNFFHKYIGNRLLRNCHIHATSEQEEKDLKQTIRPKSITVIPNLIHLPNHLELLKYGPLPLKYDFNGLSLLFLSRIEEKKGLDILFQALARIKFKWKLNIRGTGSPTYLLYLKDLADKLKISQHIFWAGQVNREDKFKLMAMYDILVLPSHNESFANVVLESLSVGTAVVISDQVGLAKYVVEKDMGWVSKLGIEEFANSIQLAWQGHEKRKQIRRQAPEIIRNDFSENNLISHYLLLYNSLLKPKT